MGGSHQHEELTMNTAVTPAVVAAEMAYRSERYRVGVKPRVLRNSRVRWAWSA